MNSQFLYRYGITVFEYEKMLVDQKNVCAICEREIGAVRKKTSIPYKLSVDHDHTTNRVRGLLCFDCNYGLGAFKEDLTRLQKAIVYLNKGG